MIRQQIDAVYEDGVLKPLDPLNLPEHQRVWLLIGTEEDEDQKNGGADYMPLVADEGDPSVTWEEVQTILAKLPGPLAADFDRERDERF